MVSKRKRFWLIAISAFVVYAGVTGFLVVRRLHAIDLVREGLALAKSQKHEQAIAKLDEALAVESRLLAAQYGKAASLRALGKLEEARRLYESILELMSKSDRVPALLGDVCCEMRDGLWAEHYYELALERTKNKGVKASVHQGWGGLEYRCHNYNDAIKHFSKVLRYAPDDPGTLCARARAYLCLNKPKKALRDCEASIEADPEFVAAYFLKGASLDRLGKTEEALYNYWAFVGSASSYHPDMDAVRTRLSSQPAVPGAGAH